MPHRDNSRILDHLLEKALEVKLHEQYAWNCQSTGEKLAVALVLNRADWLASMQYTVGEAIDRLGQDWVNLVPLVERTLRRESH